MKQEQVHRCLHGVLMLSILFVLSACVGVKQLTYFSQIEGPTKLSTPYPNKIVVGDELKIHIAAMDEMVAKPYNHVGNDYVVDEQGEVNIPILGGVKVVGLTVREATILLTEAISKQMRNPIVKIELQNVYVTVLGEVNMPGRYPYSSTFTILDAIGCAGDIKTNGKADDVIVMRVVEGQSKLYHLNLLDGSAFGSEAFYLLKGDIVYVQPRKGKSILQNAPMHIQLNNDVKNLNSTQGYGLQPTY